MLLVMSLQDLFPLIARCSIAKIDLFYKKEKNPFHNLLVLFLKTIVMILLYIKKYIMYLIISLQFSYTALGRQDITYNVL